MGCSCPLPKGKVKMGCRFYQPFRRTHRHGCMAGYHCPMPTALLSLRPHTQSIYISTLRPMTNISTFFVAPPYPICLYFHVAIHAQSINISHCKIYRLSIFPITIHSQAIAIIIYTTSFLIFWHFPLQKNNLVLAFIM